MSSGLILDFAIVGVIAVLALGGIISGLIKEGFGLAGILVGVYVSTSNADKVGSIIGKYIYSSDNEMLLRLFGFLITLIVIWGVFIILGRIISKLVSLSGLGIIDKIMGAVFAGGKIFIVFSIIASCVNAVPFLNKKIQNYFESSTIFPLLIKTGSYIANVESVQVNLDSPKVHFLEKKAEREEEIKKFKSEEGE